jgi:HK97 family phage portal protein
LEFRKKALEEVSGTEVNRLIANPNDHQSLSEIAGEFFGWMDLTGNFYLYKLLRDDPGKTINSIHVAPSQEVEIIAGTWFDPIKGYRLKAYLAHEEIDKDLIMHLKNWNPDFDYDGRQLYGVSPLQAGARILQLDNMGIDTSTSNFKNSGVRGIIHRLATGQGMNAPDFTLEQAQHAEKKIDSWTGTDKAGKIIATNAPVGFTEIGKSPVDLGVFTAMDKNQVRLCNLFKVPPELFLPGTTFSNKAEARKNMITTGILPQMENFRDQINRFAVEPLNKGRDKYYIDYDMFSIAELQDDLSKVAAMLAISPWLTDDEKREAMNYGEFGHPLAKELFVDPFKMPMSQVNYDTGFEQVDDELKRLKSKVY